MRIKVLGCGVFEPELEALIPDSSHEIDFEPLEAGLHEVPNELRVRLQAAIDQAAREGYDAVALAYGLCGRGTSGLIARDVTLVIPRVHDCLTLFLGSRDEYRRQFREHPGTYYITPGWFTRKMGMDQTGRPRLWSHDVREHPKFPELVERYGEGQAEEIVRFLGSWKRNYTRVAVIDTGCGEIEGCTQLAGQISENLGWACERISGDTEMLRALVSGNWDSDEFAVVEPGERSEASGDDQVIVAVAPGKTGREQPILDALTGARGNLGDRAGVGLGIDAGGTYTDAVVYDFGADRVLSKSKALTTHHDPLIGISDALDALEQDLLGRVGLVALSTTHATNAIVEDRGGQPGCLVMPHDGFDEARVLWPHRAVIGGRMSIGGEEIEPLDEVGCREAVRELLAEGVDAFAVSGYGSTRNPAHELAARAIIAEECDLPVVCGHELSARLNFLRRANTAALNARLLPIIDRLLEAARQTLADRGIVAPVMIVKGDGSLINVDTARERSVETVLSGPAASVLGARHLAECDDAMVIDVGGTTTDAAIITDGRPRLSPEGARVGGWQTSVEAVRIRTMGLGGDSALDFNADRELLIGPRRAVPLCYLSASGMADVAEVLGRVATRDDLIYTSAMSLTFVLPGPMATHRRLDEHERRMLDALDGAAVNRNELARRLGLASPRLLNVRQMEDRGVVARATLTPTDLLHVSGEFTAWDVEAAHAGLALFAELFGCPAEDLSESVRARITRRLALMVLSEELGGDADVEAEAEEHETLSRMVERLIVPPECEALTLGAKYSRPVIGIGAPASAFLPSLSEPLGGEVTVPEHAEVANALGAIVSHVAASEVVAVRPSEYDAFTVYAPDGRHEFESLTDAAAFAAEQAARVARKRALTAGACEPRVEVEVDRRIGRLSTGEEQLIEVNVRATAVGYPLSAAT